MAQTVVGYFNSTTEAQQAIEQLLASGFERTSLNLATQDTLRAQHIPETNAPVEPFEEGVVRFFTNLFAGNENADVQAHVAATHADSAVLTVLAATEDRADRARAMLAAHGAVDVYKQARRPNPAAPAPGSADTIVDLEGNLFRVRDAGDLDTNGLTTH